MCSPQIMAKVAEEISRRNLLRNGGIAGLAAASALSIGGLRSTRAQDATPEVSPMAGPAMISLGPVTQVVDLTHVWGPTFPVFAGATQAVFENLAMVDPDGWYANMLHFEEHTGTHMDAPAHFAGDGLTAELLSPSQLFAPLVVIDISAKAEMDPDAQGTPDDLVAFEAANGEIPAGAFVALYSGWETRLVDPATFVNLDDAGVQHYPGWHPEAAAWLVEERDIVGAGVDTLSLDYGPSADFGSHLTFLPAGKFGIENLASLGSLPAVGASIIVGGPKHEGASGGPTRAFAVM
jgi:kynurenine formamidase